LERLNKITLVASAIGAVALGSELLLNLALIDGAQLFGIKQYRQWKARHQAKKQAGVLKPLAGT
jgi:hypothetical protein